MKANKARTILLVIGGLDDDDDDNVKEGEKIVQGCTQSLTYVRTSIYYKCGGIFSKTIRNIHIQPNNGGDRGQEEEEGVVTFKFC